jgi:zinc D-Ala-D-Ala carboxypeptidase
VTEHFSNTELACKCGCGMLPKLDFMDKVQRMRDFLDFPMVVTSAARCPDYNAKVSSTGRTGPHTTGRAIDLAVSREQAYVMLAYATRHGFTGIGVAQKGAGRFIHLDDLIDEPGQPRPTVWSY